MSPDIRAMSAASATSATATVAGVQVSLDAREVEYRVVLHKGTTVHHRHLAALAAARRLAQQRAASQASPATSSTTISSSGADPAASALGACVRDTEEGGSYAWGRGNGGGAYQFLLATWEKYGGAASEYGNASSAYQDQVFNNAVRAGGASNWTDYDGC